MNATVFSAVLAAITDSKKPSKRLLSRLGGQHMHEMFARTIAIAFQVYCDQAHSHAAVWLSILELSSSTRIKDAATVYTV